MSKHTKLNLKTIRKIIRTKEETYWNAFRQLLSVQQRIFMAAFDYVMYKKLEVSEKKKIMKTFWKLNQFAKEHGLPPVFEDLQSTPPMELLFEAGHFAFAVEKLAKPPKHAHAALDAAVTSELKDTLINLQDVAEPHGIKIYEGDIEAVSDQDFLHSIQGILFGWVSMMLDDMMKNNQEKR